MVSAVRTQFAPAGPLDLVRTLAPLRHGPMDPTIRIRGDECLRATRTPLGPATLWLRSVSGTVLAEAWGEGAGWCLEHAPELIGSRDDPSALRTDNRLVAGLQRRFAGLRLSRSRGVFEALVPTVLEQKVVGIDAWRAYAGLVRSFGEPAPGPGGLLLPPSPQGWAGLRYWSFHPHNVERRRAETIRRAALIARRLDETADLSPDLARRRLTAVPGIGAWTAAEVAMSALGDADAVPLGDYHLPSAVAWALAGEGRAGDGRMLELLEPFRGQRGRVIRLLLAAGMGAPRLGPPRAIRRFAAQ